MNEKWRDVPGYEGVYQVSNLGRVRSVDRQVLSGTIHKTYYGRIRKVTGGQHAYQIVTLSKDGLIKSAHVNALVLRAFVGEPQPGMQPRHSDGNKANNVLTNLSWHVGPEKPPMWRKHGPHAIGSKRPNSALDEKKVAAIKRRLADGEAQTQLAIEYGVGISTIHSIKKGKTWGHV